MTDDFFDVSHSSEPQGSFFPASRFFDEPMLKPRIKPRIDDLSPNAKRCLIALCKSPRHAGGSGIKAKDFTVASKEALEELAENGLVTVGEFQDIVKSKRAYRRVKYYALKPIAIAMASEKGWVKL